MEITVLIKVTLGEQRVILELTACEVNTFQQVPLKWKDKTYVSLKDSFDQAFKSL